MTSSDPPGRSSAPPPEERLHLLVIDDDALVRTSLGHVLGLDHRVTLAPSAEHALSLFAAGERFDAVLCDLNMPGMDGVDFYDAAARDAPDQLARTVFLTGGAFTQRAQEFLQRVSNPTLQKPFDLLELRRVLRSVAR